MQDQEYRRQMLNRRERLKKGIYAGGATGGLMGMQLIKCVGLDTLRADRLSCYGYTQNTSPNLDQLAEDSVLYTHALSTASSTLPAHASLFTGKFTPSHGARRHPNGQRC